MKKISYILLSGLILITLLTGCIAASKVPDVVDNQKDSAKHNQGITFNPIDYTVLDNSVINFSETVLNSFPQEIKEAIEAQMEEPITLIAKGEKDSQYILIYLGMRQSGGYSIEILSVEDIEGRISVVYREVKPKKGEMVTEALTFPLVVLKIDSPLPIDVRESF